MFVSDQSTCEPPEVVSSAFATDVFWRDCQLILVVWKFVTSFTLSCLMDDERKDTFRDAVTHLCMGLCPFDGRFAVDRTGPSPGFAALAGDESLATHRLVVEVGNAKNINKNPVAEKAIQEIQGEILRLEPNCRAVTPLMLPSPLPTRTVILGHVVYLPGKSCFSATSSPTSSYPWLTRTS